MTFDFETDIIQSLNVLRKGGLILYPTDTIWGIGCDATNDAAVEKIYRLKQRDDQKAMIILVAAEKDILRYVAAPDPAIFDTLGKMPKPTTVIYQGSIGLAANIPADDGSIAIRITKDAFCRQLIKRLRKPLVSTSANISGQEYPANFKGISAEIKNGVDYIVRYRQDEESTAKPSTLIRWTNGKMEILRP